MSPAASARYDEISQRSASALAEREASRILLWEKEMLSGIGNDVTVISIMNNTLL
jgi:hypothetical protein